MYCGEWVESDHASAASEPAEVKVTIRPPTRGPTKTCPYCSAQIPEDAWTCMYCQRGVLGGRPLAIGLAAVVFLLVAVFFFAFWLPGWLEMGRKRQEMEQQHQQFQRDWDKAREEQEEFRKKHFPGQP
jgi:hypothetical protein